MVVPTSYPGDESGVCDDGQESDLAQSSFYRGQDIRGASATGLRAGEGAPRAVPCAQPGAVLRSVGDDAKVSTRLVVDGSLTDAYASGPPAQTAHLRSRTPDKISAQARPPAHSRVLDDCRRDGPVRAPAAPRARVDHHDDRDRYTCCPTSSAPPRMLRAGRSGDWCPPLCTTDEAALNPGHACPRGPRHAPPTPEWPSSPW